MFFYFLVHTKQLNELLSELTDDFTFIDIIESREFEESSLVDYEYKSVDETVVDVDYHFSLHHLGLSENDIRKLTYTDRYIQKLGLQSVDILQPTLKEIPSIEENIPKPYICFSEFASMTSKYWYYENGWQNVVDHFTNKGYTMVAISSEKTNLSNVYDLTGDSYSLIHKFGTLKDCEFFIGLDSGISWMANLLGKYCYIIHGATKEELAFQDNVTRIGISTDEYCRSCHNDISVLWDKTLLDTCFFRKDFECTKLLTSETVINMIESVME